MLCPHTAVGAVADNVLQNTCAVEPEQIMTGFVTIPYHFSHFDVEVPLAALEEPGLFLVAEVVVVGV